MRQIRLGLLCLLLLGAFIAAPALADDVGSLTKELKMALQAKDGSKVADVMRRLGALDNEKAVRTIIKVGLASDQLGFDASTSNQIFDAARDAIRGCTNPEVREYIRKMANKSRDYRQRVLFIEILQSWGEKEDLEAIVEALEDRNDAVLRAAVRAIGEMGAVEAVDALIETLERLERTGGLAWEATQKTLTDLTGEEFEKAADWKSYWEVVRERFLDNPNEMRGDSDGSGTVSRNKKRPKLFGLEIVSKRIVFVLDVSGSMREKDPPSASDGPGTGRGGGGGTRGRGGNNPGGGNPGGGGGGNTGDLPDDRMRIKRAQKELKKVIELLPKDTVFNIITFSDQFKKFKANGLVRASSSQKRKAYQFIDGFNPNGATRTDKALKMAFEISEDANTFYLLSDGSPTKRAGQTTEPLPTEPILEQVRENNKYRHVTIHTLGFPGANVSFMRRLANDNGGKYKDIR